MANKGRSAPNPFGGYTNYDETGKRSGRTEPNQIYSISASGTSAAGKR